ncbi:MAG: hypothetical protein WKG07_15580 [Hymenobacter sp.]
MNEAEYVYLNSNEHIRAVVEVETRDARFIQRHAARATRCTSTARRAACSHQLRALKSPEEIRLHAPGHARLPATPSDGC